MSTKLQELDYYLDEQYERQGGAKDLTRKPTAAEMMLAISAGGNLDQNIQSNVTFTPTSHPIEKIGSVFIDSVFFLLNHWGCPNDARDVALAICGLSGGNYMEYTKITQAQIGERAAAALP